ncbi:MAG: hypothetical protein HY420_04140 [Candidatus Kerfeldbacteria bacterium]|nr:hypothetical protein [Candidatus Kerfeldbacteria bacterium]
MTAKFSIILFVTVISAFLCIPIKPSYAATGLVLSGDEVMTISSDQTITGDIELSGNAELTISGADLTVAHGNDNPRADVILNDNAKLIITNGSLIPPLENPDNLYLTASGTSSIEITDGTFINVLNLVDDAVLTGTRARIASSAPPLNIPETAGAFGIIQLASNVQVELTDSTVGSIALFFGPDDDVQLNNLKPQTYADFDLQRDAVKFTPKYNLVLNNTTILPVKLKGPFERSWAIFVDPATNLTINDSSLNKLVFQQFINETLSFSNLKIDSAQSFDFRDVHLRDTTVANEWGFFGENSNITVSSSKGVWLWPIGTGTWKLKNSQMIEFDPRRFTGTLVFDNAEWANAGEIFEQTVITLKGTFKTTQQLNQHLAVADSTITREYQIRVKDANGKSIKSFKVTVFAGSKKVKSATTKNGTAAVRLKFTPSNYQKTLTIKAAANGKTKTSKITLFSTTPFVVRLPR